MLLEGSLVLTESESSSVVASTISLSGSCVSVSSSVVSELDVVEAIAVELVAKVVLVSCSRSVGLLSVEFPGLLVLFDLGNCLAGKWALFLESAVEIFVCATKPLVPRAVLLEECAWCCCCAGCSRWLCFR